MGSTLIAGAFCLGNVVAIPTVPVSPDGPFHWRPDIGTATIPVHQGSREYATALIRFHSSYRCRSWLMTASRSSPLRGSPRGIHSRSVHPKALAATDWVKLSNDSGGTR
jgi:hypothetical protein